MPTHGNPPAKRRHLFSKEAAYELRKSVRTLSRWRRLGIGPAWSYSIPGCNRSPVIYDVDSVDAFVRIDPQKSPTEA